jgi:hypothetical protein
MYGARNGCVGIVTGMQGEKLRIPGRVKRSFSHQSGHTGSQAHTAYFSTRKEGIFYEEKRPEL